MTDGALALVVRTTLDVDDVTAAKRTQQLLKQRGGLFPTDMTEGQAAILARLSLLYDLDPFSDDLMLLGGKPYLTLTGALRIANAHDQFDGLECSPATTEERTAFRCRDDEELWIARCYRRDRRVPSVGYGRASKTEQNPVSRTFAPEMAQKRAKHRALRDAFSLPLAGNEDAPLVIDAEPQAEPEPLYSTPLITPDQTKAIHAIARSSGFDTEHYRDALRRMFGVDSSQELTQAQAQAAIEAFAAEAPAPTAEDRVAARTEPEERNFYAALDAQATTTGESEPTFFRPLGDDLAQAQTAYMELLLEARGRGVSADEFVELDGSEGLRAILAATELLRERMAGA